MNDLENIVDFFCMNQIPLLPCYGIEDGKCTCKKGSSCPSPGKHPLGFKWQMTATCDKAKVLSWFKGKPINLAIRTGVFNKSLNKFFVGVDFDLPNHPLKEKLDKYGKTLSQESGSGGSHSFYWSKFPVKNSVQLVDEKVDIRGSGGILIIAPSLHKSGKNYKFLTDLKSAEILDIPEEIDAKLKTKAIKAKIVESRKVSGNVEKTKSGLSIKTVKEIREMFDQGYKVPLGSRNNTMHRLLSSDRAKGVLTSEELLNNAMNYLKHFEETASFENELESIVKSVLRYPAYNNSFENVNEIYMKWIKKRKIELGYTLEELQKIDDDFFENLSVKITREQPVTLETVTTLREEFFKQKGINQFSIYKSQMLAKKLISLGFVRIRTSKNNKWFFDGAKNHLTTTNKLCEYADMETEKEKIIMRDGKKYRLETIKTQTKNTQHPREHLYQGRRGQEYNKNYFKFCSKLSEEQQKAFIEEELIVDLDKTKSWISSVRIGDIIGVVDTTYQVIPKRNGAPIDSLSVVRVVRPVENEVSFLQVGKPVELLWPSVDFARELDLLDILFRDNKPYGVPEMRDITVVVFHSVDEEENQ